MNATELRHRINIARATQLDARKDGNAERIVAAERRLDELLDQLPRRETQPA